MSSDGPLSPKGNPAESTVPASTNATDDRTPWMIEDQVIEHIRRLAYGLAKSRGLDREASEDLAENVTIKVYLHPPRDPSKLQNFVYRCTANEFYDLLRRESRRPNLASWPAGLDPRHSKYENTKYTETEDEAIANEIQRREQAWLETLTEEERKLFNAVKSEPTLTIPWDKLAKEFDNTIDAIKRQYYRLQRDLCKRWIDLIDLG